MKNEQLLAEIRKLRRKEIVGYSLLVIGIIGMIAFFVTGMSIFYLALGSFVVMFVGVMIASKYSNAIKGRLGSEIVTDVLREVLDDVRYDPFGHLPDQKIRDAHMVFPFNYDRIKGSDHITAVYKGTDVEMSDIELCQVEYSTDSDGASDETEHTVFRGQWIECRLARELIGEIHISPNTKKLNKQLRNERLLVGNDLFNERFLVVADNADEAYSILDPRMTDAILSVAERNGGELYMSFVRDGLHIAVNTEYDFFERDGWKIDLAALRQKYLGCIRWFTDIIDELSLAE